MPKQDQPSIFHNALSFSRQPNIKQLFQLMRNPDLRINIVCGAGVSVDSGLPTWRGLIRNLARRVTHVPTRESILADEAALTRKADFILSLLPDFANHDDAVASALYGNEELSPSGGQLATAIALLSQTLGSRARIVTTNYDDRLEVSLGAIGESREIKPAGLKSVDTWLHDSFSSDVNSILHLHGYIPSNASTRIEPVILSESHYLACGPSVQKAIKRILETPNTVTLFVGVGMTDPSIVGPLHMLHEEGLDNSFAILSSAGTTSPSEDTPGQRAFAYAASQATYLQSHLGVQPILVKTYGQVAQAILELVASLRKSDAYFSDDPTTSLRYGNRFRRINGTVHKILGVRDGYIAPSETSSVRLSDALHASLHEKGGPIDYLEEFVSSLSYEYFEQCGITRSAVDEEMFALFLWLRVAIANTRSTAPFKLFLAGSSAYSYREGRSLVGRTTSIIGDSPIAAARAAFLGRSTVETLDLVAVERKPDKSTPWRSFLAVPFTCSEQTFDLGQLTDYPVIAGSIVLQTDRSVVDKALLEEKKGAMSPLRPSPISLMTPHQRDQLLTCVRTAGVQAVQSIMVGGVGF